MISLKCKGLFTLIAIGLLAVSCEKDEDPDPQEEPSGPKITLTKTAAAKSDWTLYIEAAEADKSKIWVDLNGNGTRDDSEAVTKFGREYANRNTFPLGTSKTIVVYGPVTVFYCSDGELSKLDVSKHIGLKELYCMAGVLTALDVSKNVALEKLNCFSNQLTSLNLSGNPNIKYAEVHDNSITATNMTQLINSLPARTVADDARLYVRQVSDSNSLPTAADVATAKSKNWKLYMFLDGMGWTEIGIS